MHPIDEIELWLSNHQNELITNRAVFAQFKNKFNLSKDEARSIIHQWDAKKRDIPQGKSRKS